VTAPCTLITGGAGFVGINLAKRLLEQGEPVRLFDSLVRSGSERNIAWLLDRYGDRAAFMRADVRDRQALASAMTNIDHVVHLAAQVAVTSSLTDPRADFEANALGTLNVLEAARACARPPSLVCRTRVRAPSLARLHIHQQGVRRTARHRAAG
jgi:CDP-paratose 2-epimerase